MRKFSKPTIDEIRAYCLERNNGIDATEFFDFYESKGWVIGKSPMKDWKAAVRTWERSRKNSYSTAPRRSAPTESVYAHNMGVMQRLHKQFHPNEDCDEQ